MITGAYVRIYRDGTWQNLDITELTPVEIDSLAKSQPERGWLWVKFFVEWIQTNVIVVLEDNDN